MGNRSLIVVTEDSTENILVMYGHWSGTENLTAVRNVLSATGRIGDSYLAGEIWHEFAVALGGYSGLDYGSFGMWATNTNDFSEGWVDNPTIYVNQDTGTYSYEGVEVTLAELLGEKTKPIEEPQIVYGKAN